MKVLKVINMILFVLLILVTPNMLIHAENMINSTEMVVDTEMTNETETIAEIEITADSTERYDEDIEDKSGYRDPSLEVEVGSPNITIISQTMPNLESDSKEMKVSEEKSGDAMIVEETINKAEELVKEETVQIDGRYEDENIDYSDNVEEDDVMIESQESVHIKSENQLQGIKIERNEKKEDGKEVGDGIKDENVIVEEQAVSIQKDENVSVDENYKTGAGLGSDICFVFAGLLSLLIIVALVCWKKLLRIRPFQ